MSSPGPRHLIRAGVGTCMVVLVALAIYAGRTVASLRTTSDSVLHTQDVRSELTAALGDLTDLESGSRGYIITGNESFLEPFAAGEAAIGPRLARLQQRMADHAGQRARLNELEPLITQKLEQARRGVELRRSGDPAAAQAHVAAASGKVLMDQIRVVIDLLEGEEKRLLAARLAAARTEGRRTVWLLATGLGLDLLLALGIFLLIRREIRVREAAAAELNQRAEEIRDLYNRAPCGYHSLDAEGRFAAVNDTEAAWLGYEREELIGKVRFIDLLTPASQEIFRASFPVFKKQGVITNLEFELQTRDGRVLPVILTASAVRDATGRFVVSRSTLFDLTERKRAERFTYQARAYAESIVDTVREPLIILTDDLRVNSANRAFHETFRTSPAAIAGESFAALGGGWWNIPELLAGLERIVPDHATLENFEITREFGPLGRKVMRLNARKLHRPGNNTTMTLVAIEDITARRQAEQERETFFSVTLDLLCISEFSGRFRRVNPAFTETLGWSLEEMQSRPYLEFVHPDDREATVAEVRRQSDGESVMSFENRYLCRDGSYRWLAWKSVPIPELGLMFATARDVTERRRGEDEITRLNAELRTRAAELEYANRELEAFSYSVSHDLRAPIRHLTGFASLLTRHAGASLDEKGRHFLATIDSAALRMGRLVDDLLEFSRVGRADLRRQPVELSALAEEVRQHLQSEVAGRVVDWEIAPLPVVPGDAALLRQVFENLLGNAVKYTRGREAARICIGPAQDPQATADHVAVSVRDNGAGFNMKYAHKLFAVFSRLHSEAEFEGTGVGLANVHRIVQRHGGRCWAESQPGEGATFYFSLPVS